MCLAKASPESQPVRLPFIALCRLVDSVYFHCASIEANSQEIKLGILSIAGEVLSHDFTNRRSEVASGLVQAKDRFPNVFCESNRGLWVRREKSKRD